MLWFLLTLCLFGLFTIVIKTKREMYVKFFVNKNVKLL